MRYIKPYQIFEASAAALQELTQEQISWLDKCAKRKWKLNAQTGLVDVNGYFDCSEQGLTDLKGVKFGKVGGHFYCGGNELTTLEGAPQSVKGCFGCEDNALTTLEGAPQTVSGHFYCGGNELTSLEGAPQTVGGDFWCDLNHLTTLEGAPQTVSGHFYCDGNELTSLEGAPQSVRGSFSCYKNELTSLEGAPQTVGHFLCADNPVTKTTLDAIFALMKSGMAYQQALEECWPEMGDEDKVLMYKQMPDISPEDVRKYKALAAYNNIKGYL